MVQPVRAASVRPVIVMVRRHPRKVGVKWMLRQDIMLVLRTVQHKQPVRRVHIKRRIRLHMVLRHLVRHAVGAQSTVRRVRQRAKRYPADTIQPDVTPVATTVLVSRSVLARHIAAVVCRIIVRLGIPPIPQLEKPRHHLVRYPVLVGHMLPRLMRRVHPSVPDTIVRHIL